MTTIALTGHTSGLGEIIAGHFTVEGFSRGNGYDLSTPEGCEKLLHYIDHYDVFINNAFPYVSLGIADGMFRQTELLYAVYDRWVDTDRLIINIGSNTSDGIKKNAWPYSAAKASLDKASEQLCYQKNSCFVSNLKLGFVDTQRVKDSFPDEKHLPSSCVVEGIEYIIKQWQAGVRVKELCLLP